MKCQSYNPPKRLRNALNTAVHRNFKVGRTLPLRSAFKVPTCFALARLGVLMGDHMGVTTAVPMQDNDLYNRQGYFFASKDL